MSWRSYELFSIQPDFTNPPQKGLGEGGMTMLEFGQAEAWGAWHGDTALAMGFTYRFDTAAEQRSLRNFANLVRGRSTPFFIPSWEPDYQLASDAVAGNTQILIAAAGISDITEDRPDTDGRQLFLTRPDGSTQAVGITAAEVVGPNELLTLDHPLAFDFPAMTSICGRLYLARLADDRIEYKLERPGHGTVSLRMVTSRQTRHVDENPLVESEDYFSLLAFQDVVATDENPLLQRFDQPDSLGPLFYGLPGELNYSSTWVGFISGLELVIQPSIGTGFATGLFDGSEAPFHWTFGFDASGKEFVAWSRNDQTIRLGFFLGGVTTRITFPGISPQAYNTFEIDSTATAATADAVLFYLRPGYSGIFARFYREDFATEYLVCRSPVYPIYLQGARSNIGKLEVFGMDSGHRRCFWRAGDYIPPFPSDIMSAEPLPLFGEYRSIAVKTGEEDGMSGGMSEEVLGEYRSTRVLCEPPAEGMSGGMMPTSGSYVSARRPATGTERATSTLATPLLGEYKLVRKLSEVSEGHSSTIQPLTGEYAP